MAQAPKSDRFALNGKLPTVPGSRVYTRAPVVTAAGGGLQVGSRPRPLTSSIQTGFSSL